MIRQMLKNRTMQVISLFLVILAIVILITMLVGCDRKKPIKVGFVGDLTGHVSDLGIAGRNGVVLAVEEVNKAGGIHGRPIIKKGVFQGLQGEITIDQYGDARRKNYLITVKDGQFITIE